MSAILQSLSITSDGSLGNFTTTSTTMVDVHSTMNLSFSSNGGFWLFYLQARASDLQAGTPPLDVHYSLFLDDVELNPRGGLGLNIRRLAALTTYHPINLSWWQVIKSGQHTIKPKFSVQSGGTVRIYNDTTLNFLKLYAIELDF